MWTIFSKRIIRMEHYFVSSNVYLGATITMIAMGWVYGTYQCIRVFQMKFEKSVSMQNLDKKPLSLWAKDNETLNFPTRNR